MHLAVGDVDEGGDFAAQIEQCMQLDGGFLAECSAERPKGDRRLLPQAAHLPDVLFVVQRKDHAARAQEQQRLEKRVRRQMEHGRRRPAQPTAITM